MSALTYARPGEDLREKFWPEVRHVLGKDILRFHCVFWPALLLAAGFEVPRQLFVHGFLLLDEQKISKTVGNVVGVTDDSEVIRKQVLSMVTDIKRPRRTDPGHPRSCNVCAFYKFFFDDWEHYWDLCRRAQIGCFDKKKLLAERMIETFAPFRERRAALSPEQVTAILDEGSVRAREVARHTMIEVRHAVGLPPYLDR